MSHFLALVFCPPDWLFATSDKAPPKSGLLLCPPAFDLELLLDFLSCEVMVDGRSRPFSQKHIGFFFSKTCLSSLNLCVQKHVRGMWEGEQKGTDTPWGGTVASVSPWVKHEGFNHAWESHMFNALITPELSPCPKCFWYVEGEPLFQVSYNKKIYGTPR